MIAGRLPQIAASRSGSGLGWAVSAALLGLLAALLPIEISPVIFAAAGYLLLAGVTPIAPLAVMLIVAPLRTLFATEVPFQLPLDIGQLALASTVFFALLYLGTRRLPLPPILRSPVFAAVLIFVLAAALSGFSAISLSSWFNEWLKWLQILVLIAVCLAFAGQAWEWLLIGLIAAGAANAVIGIYQFFGGSGALHLLINERFFRAFGTFGQPNPFGAFMGLLTPIALGAALGYGIRFLRSRRETGTSYWFYLIPISFHSVAAGLMAVALVMSWSRGAWLGFAAAIGIVIFALPQRPARSLLLLASLVIITITTWTSGWLPASITERVGSAVGELVSASDVRGVDITAENYALVERVAHWQAAVNMATAHPWLGVGFGNYETAYADYRLMNWALALGHAHNYYLNVFAETGIIGLMAYLLMWLLIIAFTWQARRHPDPLARSVAVGLLGTWVYLSVHSITDNLYVNNMFLHIGVALGILAVLHQQCSSHGHTMRDA
ncbi:MAG: O-antigen ligase family protein [Aggregatilineales bacterium]